MGSPPERTDLEVTVALIANPDDPYRQGIPDDEWERPYRARRKAHFVASSAVSLAEVMRRAAEDLGVAPPSGWHIHPNFPASRRIAFYKAGDEERFASRALPRLHWAELVLVDERGRAVFGVSDQRAVTLDDLVRAAEAGVIDGDPLRPYLLIEPGWGDAPPPDWPTVLTGLAIAWDVLERVAVVGGVWVFAQLVLERLKDRIRAGRMALENHREWAQRGTRPYQFSALFSTRDWTTSELGALLGCSDSEAEAVLWTLGFGFDEENERWSLQKDPEGSLMEEIQRQIAIASHRGGPDWENDLKRRITHLLESGEAPPIDWPPS